MKTDRSHSLSFNNCFLFVLLLIQLIAINHKSFSQQEFYVANDSILDAEVVGDKLFIGGSFTSLTAPRGSFATVNTTGTFSSASLIPKVGGGEVKSIVPDGIGGWYIGGSFTKVADQPIARLAHILSTGLVDVAWTPNPDNVVHALWLEGSTLYVGGEFTNISGSGRDGLAIFDTNTGNINSLTTDPFFNGPIYALYYSSGTLFVGGSFTTANGFAKGGMANINPTTGTLDGFNIGVNGEIRSIFVSGTTVYFGGSFNTITGGGPIVFRNHLASATSSNVISSWNPDPDQPVYKLYYDGSLYVLGLFNNIATQPIAKIAKFDPTTDTIYSSWDANLIGFPNTIVHDGLGNLFVGGRIYEANSTTVHNITAIDSTTGVPVSTYTPYFSGEVNAIAINGTTLAVGGSFGGFETKVDRNRLAAIDLRTGEPTSFDPNISGEVNALMSDGTTLYVGGGFSSVSGNPAPRGAAFTVSDGSQTAWLPSPDFSIRDIQQNPNNGNIIIVGDFTNINSGSLTRSQLAEVNPTTGSGLPLSITTNGTINKILIDGNSAYITGSFTDINSSARNRLAKISLTDGSLDATWNPSADSTVSGMFINDNGVTKTLYVTGSFVNINATPREGIAEINLLDAGTLTSWDPSTANPSLIMNNASNIVKIGTEVFVAGQFIQVGSDVTQPFIKFDSTTSAVISGSNFGEGSGKSLYFNQSTNHLFALGNFIGASDEPYQSLSIINGPLVNIESPTVVPLTTLIDGSTVSGNKGFWMGVPKISYQTQWYRCNESGVLCDPISGETGTTYVLSVADVGGQVQYRVTAQDATGSIVTESANSSVVDPLNTVLHTINGTTQSGETLTSSNGTWNGATGLNFLYQWRRCNSSGASCSNISGETSQTYILTEADIGSTIRVNLSAQKNGSAGANTVQSAQTGVVSPAPTATATATPTQTPTFTPTQTPSVTATPTEDATQTPSATASPTPICSLPKPSAKVTSGKIVVKYPRATRLNGCTTSTLKSNLVLTMGSRTKTLNARFKRVSTKKFAQFSIKPALKNKRGQLRLTAKDILTGVTVFGVTKQIKTK